MNDGALVGARGTSADAAGGPAAAARVDAARAGRHFYWSASGRSWFGCTIKASSKLKGKSINEHSSIAHNHPSRSDSGECPCGIRSESEL
jgi:hypothetical protein